jgi:glycosyltransferase involved in cell wall biosynthesis
MNSYNKQNDSLSIAHFSWEYPPKIWGGLGTFIAELTKQQKTMGHEVTVFAVNNRNSLESYQKWNDISVYRPKIIDFTDCLSLISNNDLKQWGTHLSFFSTVLMYNLLSSSKLVENCYSHQSSIDIIDGHDWLGILGGIIAKKELEKPLVFHVHSTEYGRSAGAGSPTILSIERHGGEVADGVITVSYAMRNELISLGFPEEKIHVCWNGIDPEKYNPKNVSIEERKNLRQFYNISDDEIFLFFIGRLVTVKGISQLIEAMPNILNDFPMVKLVVLGIGDLEEDLKRRVIELGIKDHVIFRTEFVSEEERILHYAASDLVVLPSLYEPFGIVCTEAMSMKKPVVVGARGVTGMREQIVAEGSEQCGVHMNPYDPNDIAWGVKELLSRQSDWGWIGDNARKRVYDLFTWQKITERTMMIYKNIIQSCQKKVVNPIYK